MEKITHISFPGIGIGEMRINNVAFTVFDRNIMWYGVIIALGIIAAFSYVCYRAKKNENVKFDDVLDYAIYLVIFGVIGARLYYVLTSFDNFKADTVWKTLYNMIAVWEGGLAIYGGIIAGAIALITVSRIKKINVARAFDMIAPGVMIAQAIGRWGNFMNAEAHGGETDIFCRMGLRADGSDVTKYVHPTFLYESLWNIVGFILINIFYKKKKYNGQMFVWYITWYGFGRMLIEGLRTDSLYVGDFRISQLIGFMCFFFGLAFETAMAINRAINKKRAVTAASGAEPALAEGTDKSEICTDEANTDDGEAQSASAEDSFDISKNYSDSDDDEED